MARFAPRLTKDLVDNARDRWRGMDHDAVPGNVFFRSMQVQDELPLRRPCAPLTFVRSSSRRLNVSRSTSRTNTASNTSMKREKFLEPPQKKVAASCRSAAKARTFPTSQM